MIEVRGESNNDEGISYPVARTQGAPGAARPRCYNGEDISHPLQLIHRRVVAEKMDLVTMMKESPTPLQQRASSGDTRIVSRYNDEGISYPVATGIVSSTSGGIGLQW